jgi:hypothetical protein
MKSDSLTHSITRIRYVYLLIYTVFNLSMPSATVINVLNFYVLPTRRIYVFCVDLRTNSDYFLIQH